MALIRTERPVPKACPSLQLLPSDGILILQSAEPGCQYFHSGPQDSSHSVGPGRGSERRTCVRGTKRREDLRSWVHSANRQWLCARSVLTPGDEKQRLLKPELGDSLSRCVLV